MPSNFPGFHEKRSCYIQPFEYHDGPERRIVCYDMECTTKLVPHPKITQIKHVVGEFPIKSIQNKKVNN
jgi:hypothetical protein